MPLLAGVLLGRTVRVWERRDALLSLVPETKEGLRAGGGQRGGDGAAIGREGLGYGGPGSVASQVGGGLDLKRHGRHGPIEEQVGTGVGDGELRHLAGQDLSDLSGPRV